MALNKNLQVASPRNVASLKLVTLIFHLSDIFLYRFVVFLLAENFHTLALEGVPIFGLHNRAAAYRFVTLVDVCSHFFLLVFLVVFRSYDT